KLQTLAGQLNQAKQSYQQAVLTRDTLEAQLKQVPQFRPAGTFTNGNGSGGVAGVQAASPLANRLATAQANLAMLRLKYTDAHPDVIALKNEVADLEAQVQAANAATAAAIAAAKAAAASSASTDTQAQTPVIASEIANPTYDSIRLRLVDAQTLVPTAK